MDDVLTLGEAVAAEYRAIRPGIDLDGTDPAAIFAAVHREREPLAALCISGGGIRSATFALGAVQGLADRGLLERFDYLSTVSGGGYLGGLLSAWAHRTGGLANVVPRLRPDAAAPARGECDPVQHLREYNNYLTPRLGALSADAWTLIATVLRNVLLNWLVVIPILMLVSMAPRFYLAALAFPGRVYGDVVFRGDTPDYQAPVLNAVSNSPVVYILLPASSGFFFAFALYNVLLFLPGVGGRDHTRNDFIVRILVPLGAGVLSFLAFDSLFYLGDNFVDVSNVLGIVLWTVLPAATAWFAFLLLHGRSVRERLRLLLGPLPLAIAFMAAGTGFAAWLTVNLLLWSPNPDTAPSWAKYVTIGPPMLLLGFCFGTVLFMGLTSRFLTDNDREWSSRAVGIVLIASVVWTGVCGVVLVLPRWALEREWLNGVLAAVGTSSAAVSALGGALGGSLVSGADGHGKRATFYNWVVAKLAPPLFIGCLFVGLAVLLDVILTSVGALPRLSALGVLTIRDAKGASVPWNAHYDVLDDASLVLLTAVAAALAAFAWVMARYVNINTFSLHGMYRDRLIRAYLGASNPQRRAHRFTGLSGDDDLPMHTLAHPGQPLHVVNLTLNLVSSSRLAWQQRKAEPFSVTPLHCGSRELGYRSSSEYAGGITLGTAVAISGAAASPNMGYNSSPVVSFIMTLFNARLGSWLGNPGPAGARSWKQKGPHSVVRSLVKEALGLTSDRSEYVYLSDGGHFDNLGLFEMVLRRCRLIVVLDGGCDPELGFDDLGNALRKIRIDLKIPIVFDDAHMRSLRERTRRCAVASIRYSAVDGACADGWLLYIKPVRLGDEPPDVMSYAAAHPTFPHQSTSEQWFDESQTESYRMLGLFTVDEILRGWRSGRVDELQRHVENVYLGAAGPVSPEAPKTPPPLAIG